MDFDRAYRSSAAYFGAEAERTLLPFAPRLPAGARVLDVGCGQGRNCFPLARLGVGVDALDPSAEGLEQVARTAEENGWPVRTLRGTLAELPEPEERYGGVLLFGLFPLLDPGEIRAALQRSLELLGPGGLLWITAFTTEDPACEKWRARAVASEGNSFRVKSGDRRTFLAPGEVVELVRESGPAELEVLHLWEGLGEEHRHGDGPLERHGEVEAVFRIG